MQAEAVENVDVDCNDCPVEIEASEVGVDGAKTDAQ